MINEDRSLENPNISYVPLSPNSHHILNHMLKTMNFCTRSSLSKFSTNWIVMLAKILSNDVLEQLQIHLTNVDKVFASKFELNYMVNITVAVIWNSSRLS